MRLAVALLGACSGAAADGASPLVATVPPAAPAGAATPATSPRRATADEDLSCAPTMFSEHPAGTRGLWTFEDPSTSLYGYRDEAGTVRIQPRFRYAYEFSPEGVAGAIYGARGVFIDTSGKVLADAFMEDNGPDYFVAGRARIVDQGKVGFLDASGRVVVAPRFDGAGAFCEGLAVVCVGCTTRKSGEHDEWVGGRWGYIDRSGGWAIAPRFDAAEPFADGRAEVVKNGARLEIDRRGQIVPAAP